MKACSVCGRPVTTGNRCARHPKTLRNRDRAHTTAARQVVQAATRCGICGGPPTPDDPFVADHIEPLALGGADTPDNLQAAHRSCNGRKGWEISETRIEP